MVRSTHTAPAFGQRGSYCAYKAGRLEQLHVAVLLLFRLKARGHQPVQVSVPDDLGEAPADWSGSRTPSISSAAVLTSSVAPPAR